MDGAVKVEVAYPPNYDEIAKKFPLKKGVIFTYGDTIYNPDDVEISRHLYAHESIHATRQGITPHIWWHSYLNDTQFRYEEELMAHRMEFFVAAHGTKDLNLRNKHLTYIAMRLCSPLYGLGISMARARKEVAENV